MRLYSLVHTSELYQNIKWMCSIILAPQWANENIPKWYFSAVVCILLEIAKIPVIADNFLF